MKLTAAALALAALLVTAGPAAASEEILIPGCAMNYVGHNTYHGTYLAESTGTWTITEIWQAKTRKQINQFLNRTTFKVWFDGIRVTGTWSAPYPQDGEWRTKWSRVHPADDGLVVKTRIIFNQRLTDGYYWFHAGEKGSLLICDIWGG